MEVHLKNSKMFVSYSLLKEKGIKDKTIEMWSIRKVVNKITIEGKIYVEYDSIPQKTRAKLPSELELIGEYNLQQYEEKVNSHLQPLKYAFSDGFIEHLEYYRSKYTTLNRAKWNTAAKLHAVWKYIIEEAGKDSFTLFNAFNKVYPGKYKSYNCFANSKSKAIKNGAEYMAIDQRWFTTPLNVKEVSVLNKFWASNLISIGKKYSNRQVWRMLCKLCEQANEKAPSVEWVHKYRKELLKKNGSVYSSRYGKEAANATQMSFATMQPALNANSQWQMDGWTLPFWVELPNKDGSKEKIYNRFVIVIVRDAYSKKIVGSAIGETENTTVILAALKDAIINTGCLPFEILTDNHSFNQTKEAQYFKEEIGKIGTVFTITHSPTHKSIIERYNRNLDTICKDYYGYIGEGVKSKNVDARPKQELLDKYGKNQLTRNEILLIGIKLVEDFNNEILTKEGKTPNQLFEESEKPKCYPVNVFERIKILTAKTECKVIRGQITIKRGIAKHEFQLPASISGDYNNKVVVVRYEDLNESIYLYDFDTDKAIIELKPKPIIHGAKADQTEKDIELLNKNKGRLVGIKSKAEKENEVLTKKAMEINPNAYEYLNKITTPKNILKEIEQDANLKRIAEDKGINLKLIHIEDRESELDNVSLMPKRKTNDSPFQPKNNTIRKVNLNDFID